MARFLGGLNREIANVVELHHYVDFLSIAASFSSTVKLTPAISKLNKQISNNKKVIRYVKSFQAHNLTCLHSVISLHSCLHSIGFYPKLCSHSLPFTTIEFFLNSITNQLNSQNGQLRCSPQASRNTMYI